MNDFKITIQVPMPWKLFISNNLCAPAAGMWQNNVKSSTCHDTSDRVERFTVSCEQYMSLAAMAPCLTHLVWLVG